MVKSMNETADMEKDLYSKFFSKLSDLGNSTDKACEKLFNNLTVFIRSLMTSKNLSNKKKEPSLMFAIVH